jgi:hypothetical protein
MSEFIFMGDSWALKGFTDKNWHFANNDPMPGDTRLADHWPWQYEYCLKPGHGNLACLEKFKTKKIDPSIPLIWVYTEPGRDYNIITGRPPFEWIESEEIFEIRKHLERETLDRIKNEIKNPIGFIGGYSDLNIDLIESHGYTVLHPSWQRWIAEKLNSQWFKHGWGAGDIGWRADHNNVKPSKSALFAWDEQIKEWCWWEEEGYFCHEHPTPRANAEFAAYLLPQVETWLKKHEK